MEIKVKVENLTINSSQDIFYVMQQILKREKKNKRYDATKEHFWVIALNGTHRILNIELVSIGLSDVVYIKPLDILRIPLQKNAKGVVLVHNHPSGHLEPSEADKDTTNRLIQACKIMCIKVRDHLIITENSYYSFESSGLLDFLSNSNKYMLSHDLEKELHEEYEAKLKLLEQEHKKKIKEGLEKWLNKGIAQGREKGREEGRLITAKQLLALGIDHHIILQATGLSAEELYLFSKEMDDKGLKKP